MNLQALMKRVFDVIAAACGLILLAPLFAIIALWIKADSPGPVFYRQVRVGRNGVPFRIHKFRTMRVDADRLGGLTIGADKRITQSGHFLRHYKLDELAQLIDVFQGSMSLVGPRPEIPEFMAEYAPAVRAKILSVKPGITDNASIEMIDESTLLAGFADPRQAYIDTIMPIKAAYYTAYADKHSFLGDIVIILKTLRALIR